MNNNPVILRELACSDMVRNALQNNAYHHPVANDDLFGTQLERLSDAESTSEVRSNSPERNAGLADGGATTHIEVV